MNSEMLYKHCFLSKVCLERSYDMKRSYCFPLGNILCKNDIFSNIQKLSPGGVLNNSAKFAEKYVCVGVSFLKKKKKRKKRIRHCCFTVVPVNIVKLVRRPSLYLQTCLENYSSY